MIKSTRIKVLKESLNSHRKFRSTIHGCAGCSQSAILKNERDWSELNSWQRFIPLHRGKMADKTEEFVVAGEKYGSGNLERKYRFSAENGNLERIGRKRETVATSVKQFFKVTFRWHASGLTVLISSFEIGRLPPTPSLLILRVLIHPIG